MTTGPDTSGGPARSEACSPAISVVRGNPTGAELAAVVAALMSRPAAAVPSDTPARHREWSARARLLRQPLTPGRRAWHASALPR